MSRFPRPEAEITALAGTLVAGLTAGHEVFPSPPVSTERLMELRATYLEAQNQVVAAEAMTGQALESKDARLAELVKAMKTDLRYAEQTARRDEELLKTLGWGGRRVRSPQPAPGQTRLLVVEELDGESVTLRWKAPTDGGKVLAYRILRREYPAGAWAQIAMAVVCEATLEDQPRGSVCEYRVVAVNRAGEGEPSNTVVVVLPQDKRM
jgi:hypothetical protein